MVQGFNSIPAIPVLPQDVDLTMSFKANAAPGQFSLLAFEGDEALCDGFEMSIDLVSNQSNINLHNLLDTPASIGIYHKYDQPRFLHGIIAEIEKGQSGFARTRYHVVLKPAIHRLRYISDSRIFQELSVPDISKKILQENGVTAIDWQLAMPHETREYCVQYNETCYDFLKRIWAEEGMFFWFEHSASTHKMIVSDAPLAMPMLKAAQSIAYNNLPGGAKKGFWVSRFNQKERLRATRRVSKDYTFKQPSAPHLYEVGQYMPNGAKGEYELYTYPGRHKTPGTGQPFNDYALEAHRVEATTAEGETNNIQLSSGFIFALFDHPDETLNSNHRLLRVTHKGKQPSALEEEAPEDEATTYTAYFISQPARIPYRPINPNPKPMVEGPQIAVVTGPKGEEIYCDEHGRIKVWFPWDRHGKKDEKSSCWVRVSQSWAGGNWGTMAVPRIGQEVICDFLSGDPDQPIITGRTYHAMNKPPYPLPDHKTRMTIKSQTHKGEGYNEITFEDEAEKEFVYIHAQKDMELHVKNSYQKRVEFDSTESIGNNSHLAVAKDRIEKVDGNQDMTVVGNLTEKVEGDHNLTIEGILQAKSAGDFTFKSDGNIIFDASQITLVSGSTALVVSSSGVDIAPVLNVGSASAGAAGAPPAPAVLETAAGEGSPFVSHCPKKDA